MNLYQPTISGSLTVSGSVIVDGTIIMTSGSISGTASLAENSLLLNNLNSGSFAGTGSFSNVSSSFAATSGSLSTRVTDLEATSSVLTATSASFATTSGSLSSRVTIIEGQDATTGSNTFTGVQYISEASNAISFTSTASLYTDGGLRVAKDSFVSGTAYFNNITVYGTSSIQYITSSQVNIGSNIITVNTDTPAVRFGGLSVFDSGSTQLTGSLFWDSEKNHWIYSNPSGSSYNSGMIMSGPRNSGSLGDEQGTTLNALMKGQGGDHITSSQIFDDGITVRIPGALQVTGSTIITGALTGSNSTFSGNVLIGTTTLSTKLTVQDSANTYPVHISGNGQTNGVAIGTNSSNVATIQGYTRTFSATNNVAINPDGGNVGIGTTTPNSTLQVFGNNGTSTAAVLRLRDANTTARTTRLQFEDYTGALADGLIDFRIGTAGNASTATLSIGINSAGLTFNSSNAATFSSSVTAINAILTSGGTERYLQLSGYNSSYATIRSNVGFNSSYNNLSILLNVNATENGQGNNTIPSWAINLGGNEGDADSFCILRSPAGSYTFSNLLKISGTGAATFANNITAAGNINANNIKLLSFTLPGPSTPISTGLPINAYSGGRTYLLLTSQQWSDGNNTSSTITMIRCGYDGNNFSAVVLGSSNATLETWSQSGGILFVTGNTNFQLDILVLSNG